MAQLVKTVNGLAIASTKSFNGLAIASAKTIIGLDNTSGGGGITPPTFISENETAWNTTTTPKSPTAFAVTAGDILIGIGAVEGASTIVTIADSATNAWTTRQDVNAANNCHVYLWTATAATTTTLTVTLTDNSGSLKWGGNILVFRGSGGIGATTSTNSTGAPSLGITTTANNSAIVAINADWAAVDGAVRTWLTVNSITPTAGNGLEKTYMFDGSAYTVYGAYWNDAGTAGAKTVGLSAPGGQTFSIAAVEVKGV